MLEQAEEYEVLFNGEMIDNRPSGYYLDRGFQTIALPEIPIGKNIITLKMNYRDSSELENIYLIGSFGVNVQRELIQEPEQLSLGNWVTQGLFHYAGDVTYHLITALPHECEKVFLHLPEVVGTAIQLSVDGQKTMLPWNWEKLIDVTPFIRLKKNKSEIAIDIKVIGSLRNMLGPLHLKTYRDRTVGHDFYPEGEEYSSEYLTVPYGMMKPVELYFL